MEKLYLHGNHTFSTSVWEAFSLLLCNTESVNDIYNMSNNTLEDIVCHGLPSNVSTLLELNRGSNKNQVAMKKILLHYPCFDASAFVEWDLKLLPSIVDWFDRAEISADLCPKKLSTFYQFTQAMPWNLCHPGQARAKGRQ